jgi:hypothetical protein
MNKNKILYFYHNVKQLSLSKDLPDVVLKEYVGDGHIILDKTLLCRRNINNLQNELKADGRTTLTTIKRNINLCPECVDRWKETPIQKAFRMYAELCDRADAVNVPHDPLPENCTIDQARAQYKELAEMVKDAEEQDAADKD